MKKIFLTIVMITVAYSIASAQTKTTAAFAHLDECSLLMDIYTPDAGVDSAGKPVILFVHGGGFKKYTREEADYTDWFKAMAAKGYPVVSIDYRLGLKTVRYKNKLQFSGHFHKAINIAVEDLFTATNYILAHGNELGIGGRPIIAAGSSAGAITVLQSEWEIANHRSLAKVLPEGFNYAGVMAFSGAIMSKDGKVKYENEPCPQLLMHGTADGVVNYGGIAIFKLWFGGSDKVAKVLKKEDRNYQIWRFPGHGHEINCALMQNIDREISFIERNVMGGEKVVIDAYVDEPTIIIPEGGLKRKTAELYNND